MGLEKYSFEPPKDEPPLGEKPTRKVIKLGKDVPERKKEDGPKDIPESLARKIRNIDDYKGYLQYPVIARNTKARQAYLKAAAKHVNPEVRAAVAQHSEASAELILEISEYVAPRSTKVALSVLVAIAQRKDPIGGADKTREKIFKNILKYAGDPGRPIDIKAAVYARADLPHSMIKERLAKGYSFSLLLEELKTSDPKVLKYFIQAIDKRKEKGDFKMNKTDLINLAKHPALNTRIVPKLLKVAKKNECEVRILMELVDNESLTEEEKNKLKLKQKLNIAERKAEYKKIKESKSVLTLTRLAKSTKDPKSFKLLIKRAKGAYKEYEQNLEKAKEEAHPMDQRFIMRQAREILDEWRNVLYEIANSKHFPQNLREQLLSAAKEIGYREAIEGVLDDKK